MRPAVEMSYLDEDTQRDIVDFIDENECFPSHAQTIQLRKMFNDGIENCCQRPCLPKKQRNMSAKRLNITTAFCKDRETVMKGSVATNFTHPFLTI